MRVSRIVFFISMALAAMSASAQAPAPAVPASVAISIPTAATPQPGQVLAAGTVPDEASKAAVL
ncbi:MAG: cell envelope biogenesis protein OmpA, partial [Janthinobacterium sp.]